MAARVQAEQLVATIYGAMLSARAMNDAGLFARIVDRELAAIVA